LKLRLNAVCYLAMYFLGIYISVYQNHINTISSDYSLTGAAAGTIVSLHFIGCLVSPVISGEIADRKGKKFIIIIALAVMDSGLLFLCLFESMILLSVGVFLIGSGFAVVEGMLSGVLSDNNSKHTSKVINLSQMFFCIGAISGPLLALLFSCFFIGWRPVFALLIIMFSIIIVLVYFTDIQNQNQLETKQRKSITLCLMRERIFIVLCVSIFLYVGIEEGVAFWTTTYFDDVIDHKILGSIALSGYWGGMGGGRYIASKLEKKQKSLIFIGLIISLFLSLILILAKNPIINFVCFIGIGFGFAVLWPSIMSITAQKYSNYTGTSLGIMMTFSAAGGVSIPFVIGLLSDSFALQASFAIIPLVVCIILLLQLKLYYQPASLKSGDEQV
jgi:FHS family glucose/mannose:H+ symporter-like MFS transporter